LGVGKAWISLDSLVRIQTYQWVTSDFLWKFFYARSGSAERRPPLLSGRSHCSMPLAHSATPVVASPKAPSSGRRAFLARNCREFDALSYSDGVGDAPMNAFAVKAPASLALHARGRTACRWRACRHHAPDRRLPAVEIQGARAWR